MFLQIEAALRAAERLDYSVSDAADFSAILSVEAAALL
jgi:hypothetical protein